MIKLKLSREQLTILCNLTNPAYWEEKVIDAISWKDFDDLDLMFNLIEIGVQSAKKLLFVNKKLYMISLKYTEAASLLTHTAVIDDISPLSYEFNFITMLRSDLYNQLTNYQKQFFYGQQNRSALFIRGDQGTGGAIAKPA